MARQARIHIDGGYYHVMLRGNAGDDIFFSDEERYHFYRLLKDGVERFEHRIHAFCLMDNHVHLVIQVGNVSLSRIMQNLSLRYTRWFNLRRNRSGHLFQGRFKALLIDADSYLLELVRYTHLNPVRAGMLKHPSDYLWSSHLAYLGDQVLPWLTTGVVLSHFPHQRGYADFVLDGLSGAYQPSFHIGIRDRRILGDDHFAEQMLARKEGFRQETSLADCIHHVCEFYGLQPSALSERNRVRKHAEARAVVAWLMREHQVVSLTEIASHFHRDVATLSTAVRKLERKLIDDDCFRASIDNIKI